MSTPTKFTSVQVGQNVILSVGLTADLPDATATPVGAMRVITDNGVGDDEFAVVVNDGTAWVAISTAALS